MTFQLVSLHILYNSDEEIDVPDYLLVNTSQVQSTLRRITTTKSPGPDKIPNIILNTFAFEFAPVISDLYNSSLQQGVFPNLLKRSFVIPIPKTSPPKLMEEDLCPISLTSQVSKIMDFLESPMSEVADKLDKKQFALPQKSTTQALVYLLHQLHAALDRGHCAVRLFFADFKKGFNLVDHNVVIAELQNLDVHPILVQWIKSFRTEREQCVRIGKFTWSRKSTEVCPKEQNWVFFCFLW